MIIPDVLEVFGTSKEYSLARFNTTFYSESCRLRLYRYFLFVGSEFAPFQLHCIKVR